MTSPRPSVPPAASTQSRWRLVACDLDGTLIGWNHKINDRDLESLRRARAAGFQVALCTGRNAVECSGILGALDLPAPRGLGVFANGAMIADTQTGRTVASQPITDALAQEAIDFFGSRGRAVLVLADDPATRLPAYAITNHGPAHRATMDWLVVNRMAAQPVQELPRTFGGRIVRLGTVVGVEEQAALHAELRAQFHGRAAMHSIYSPHYDVQIVELFHADVNKWTGLVQLAEHLNIEPGQIITIGDDINDVAMLQGAALSFAMGSAVAEIRGMAKRITAAQEECGVACVVEKLLAGELEEV